MSLLKVQERALPPPPLLTLAHPSPLRLTRQQLFQLPQLPFVQLQQQLLQSQLLQLQQQPLFLLTISLIRFLRLQDDQQSRQLVLPVLPFTIYRVQFFWLQAWLQVDQTLLMLIYPSQPYLTLPIQQLLPLLTVSRVRFYRPPFMLIYLIPPF